MLLAMWPSFVQVLPNSTGLLLKLTDHVLPEGDSFTGKMDQVTVMDTVMLTGLETRMIINQRQNIRSRSVVQQETVMHSPFDCRS